MWWKSFARRNRQSMPVGWSRSRTARGSPGVHPYSHELSKARALARRGWRAISLSAEILFCLNDAGGRGVKFHYSLKYRRQANESSTAPTRGMRHVALFATDLEASEAFYVDLLGMTVEWRPDDDNVYLTSGNDNLALHRVSGDGSRVSWTI